MDNKNLILWGFMLFFIIGGIASAWWTPYDSINLRNTYEIVNATNATVYGNLTLGTPNNTAINNTIVLILIPNQSGYIFFQGSAPFYFNYNTTINGTIDALQVYENGVSLNDTLGEYVRGYVADNLQTGAGNTSAEIWGIVDNGTFYKLADGMSYTNITNEPWIETSNEGNLNVNASAWWDSLDAPLSVWGRGNLSLEIWVVINNGTYYKLADGMSYTNITDEPWIEDSQESNLNVNASNYWDSLDTPPAVWGADPYINDTEESNLNVNASVFCNASEYLGSESASAFQDDIGSDCSASNYVYGVQNDGTLLCSVPAGGGAGVSMWVDNGTYLTPNTTYANSVNLSEAGAFIDVIGSYYMGGIHLDDLYLNITDYLTNTSLEIWAVVDNGTFAELDTGMSYTNITDEPWLENTTGWSNYANASGTADLWDALDSPPSAWGRGNNTEEVQDMAGSMASTGLTYNDAGDALTVDLGTSIDDTEVDNDITIDSTKNITTTDTLIGNLTDGGNNFNLYWNGTCEMLEVGSTTIAICP